LTGPIKILRTDGFQRTDGNQDFFTPDPRSAQKIRTGTDPLESTNFGQKISRNKVCLLNIPKK